MYTVLTITNLVDAFNCGCFTLCANGSLDNTGTRRQPRVHRLSCSSFRDIQLSRRLWRDHFPHTYHNLLDALDVSKAVTDHDEDSDTPLLQIRVDPPPLEAQPLLESHLQ